MKTRTHWSCCVLGIALLAKLVTAAVQGDTSLTVLIDDRANVGSKTLVKTEGLVGEIFADAGINTHWEHVRPALVDDVVRNDFSATAAGTSCNRPLNRARVTVQIISRAPDGFPKQALGYALLPCARRGIQVTLYADRVEQVSHVNLASFHRVLAHAMAHELGHILLQSDAHEKSGLMKGIWAKSDWQRAAVSVIPFSSAQSRQCREELLAHSDTALSAHSRLDRH